MGNVKQKQTRISIKLLLFVIFISYLFFMFETFQVTYSEYTDVQKEILKIQKQKEDLEHKINQFQKDIDALKDEELIEGVLRKNGYGRAGEIIYIYDNPEPVKPIDEIFNTDKKVSFPEAIINFISGKDG
jgi:cell division protein FtsB